MPFLDVLRKRKKARVEEITATRAAVEISLKKTWSNARPPRISMVVADDYCDSSLVCQVGRIHRHPQSIRQLHVYVLRDDKNLRTYWSWNTLLVFILGGRIYFSKTRTS